MSAIGKAMALLTTAGITRTQAVRAVLLTIIIGTLVLALVGAAGLIFGV